MNPGETSSIDLAMRDEVDCFVNVGADAGAHFPIQAVQHLKKHPFITVDPNFCMASEIADLHIPVRIAGVDEPGVVYRMDNVPIQFKAVHQGPAGRTERRGTLRPGLRADVRTDQDRANLACGKGRPEIPAQHEPGGELKMASGEIIVKGGFVIDPTRKIDGDVGDVAIKDGKIVDKVSSSAKVIDAKGKIVMAGGVDVHAHVAGPKVNVGRLFRPEDKLLSGFCRSGMAQKNGYRMESGFSIPSTFKTGYDYARMGYGFVMEAAMPPIHSPHVHEEIHDTPIIDEAALPGLWQQLVRHGLPQEGRGREHRSLHRLAPQGHERLWCQGRQPRRHCCLGLGS